MYNSHYKYFDHLKPFEEEEIKGMNVSFYERINQVFLTNLADCAVAASLI